MRSRLSSAEKLHRLFRKFRKSWTSCVVKDSPGHHSNLGNFPSAFVHRHCPQSVFTRRTSSILEVRHPSRTRIFGKRGAPQRASRTAWWRQSTADIKARWLQHKAALIDRQMNVDPELIRLGGRASTGPLRDRPEGVTELSLCALSPAQCVAPSHLWEANPSSSSGACDAQLGYSRLQCRRGIPCNSVPISE